MTNKLPKEFWPYFWDVDPKNIDPEKDNLLVIQRLLDWNDFSAAKWVLDNFSSSDIKKSLTDLRGWSKRSANFWANYFNLPKAKILCLQRGSPYQQASHWSY